MGLKILTLSSQGWFPGNQLPLTGNLGAFQKSPHYHNKRQLYHSHHLGNSKGFGSSVKRMFRIENYNVTLLNFQGPKVILSVIQEECHNYTIL